MTTVYKSVTYVGCIKIDNYDGMHWCSHDAVYNRGWSDCTSKCNRTAQRPWWKWFLVVLAPLAVGAGGGLLFNRYQQRTAAATADRLSEAPRDNVDSQFWKSAKARQTYRKSVLTKGAEESKSEEDERTGSSHAASPPPPASAHASYRDRRKEAVASGSSTS